MASMEPREQNIVIFGIVAAVLALFFGFMWLRKPAVHVVEKPVVNRSQTPGPARPSSNEKSLAVIQTKADRPPESERPPARLRPAFSENSDGYAWRSASETTKRSHCRFLASVTSLGNDAAFYYELLDTAYDTTDSRILKVRIVDLVLFGEEARRDPRTLDRMLKLTEP